MLITAFNACGKTALDIKSLHPLSHFGSPAPLVYLLPCLRVRFSRTPHTRLPSRPPYSLRAIPHAFPIKPIACSPQGACSPQRFSTLLLQNWCSPAARLGPVTQAQNPLPPPLLPTPPGHPSVPPSPPAPMQPPPIPSLSPASSSPDRATLHHLRDARLPRTTQPCPPLPSRPSGQGPLPAGRRCPRPAEQARLGEAGAGRGKG